MREYFWPVEERNWKATSRKVDNSLRSNHPISQQQESGLHKTDNKMHPMKTHRVTVYVTHRINTVPLMLRKPHLGSPVCLGFLF